MTTARSPLRASWIAVAAVAAGLVTALFLVAVPLAGAADSAITGAFLLAIAFGWALLYVLTRRFASGPLRWALAPALVLGTAGLALLVLRPGTVAMDRMNWVWPPFVLALALWSFGRIRATSRGFGRLVLTTAVVVLGLSAVGAGYEDIAAARDRDDVVAPGRTFAVDGHQLHLWCQGSGQPTVVLENGLGEVSASWARVMDAASQQTRVCAHDRAGQGWSEPSDSARSASGAAADLHELLQVAGETGPFVLAGHSTGGAYSLAYAHAYPDEVAGMVLLDSTSPEQFSILPAYPGLYAAMRRGLALLPTVAHLGLPRAIAAVSGSGLPGPAAAQVDAVTVTARAASVVRAEISSLPQVLAQARKLTSLQARPLVVVTADATLADEGWARAQGVLAALSTNSLQVTVHSSHVGLLADAAGAHASVAAIERAVTAVRSHTRVGTR